MPSETFQIMVAFQSQIRDWQPGGQTTAAVVKTQRSGKVKILHSLKGLVGGECCGNNDRMAETVPSNRAKLIDVQICSPYHWWIGLLKCWISCEFLAMQSHSHWAIWFTAQFQEPYLPLSRCLNHSVRKALPTSYWSFNIQQKQHDLFPLLGMVSDCSSISSGCFLLT